MNVYESIPTMEKGEIRLRPVTAEDESASGGHGASPFSNVCCATHVAIVAKEQPCVKGKFAICSCFFSKASHFLHADVMLGG